MAESKIRTEARKLSIRLASNPDLMEEFKLGVQEGMEQGINKQIDSLVAAQEQLSKFLKGMAPETQGIKEKRQAAAKKGAATRAANKTKRGKKRGRKIRRHGEQELKLRTLLRDKANLKKVVKRLYGATNVPDSAPENMWFKTTDLVRKVWQECFSNRLPSVVIAQGVASYIKPTLVDMEKKGIAKRKGNTSMTRWLLLEV
ncbi:MAG TPA: hypothetical protein VMW91_02950 [Desulfosporosinus sp.]|nr:hypothetical protein [Desulfosporosinus sp.]